MCCRWTPQVISSLGDYLTANGGRVNLRQVDVIMSEVGEIEDEVFRRRKAAETIEQVRVLPFLFTCSFLVGPSLAPPCLAPTSHEFTPGEL